MMTKPVQEFNKWVDRKRAEGMYEYNLAHLDQDIETLMRERKPKKIICECALSAKGSIQIEHFTNTKKSVAEKAILSNKKH